MACRSADLGAQSDLIGAPEPMSITAVFGRPPNGGYFPDAVGDGDCRAWRGSSPWCAVVAVAGSEGAGRSTGERAIWLGQATVLRAAVSAW